MMIRHIRHTVHYMRRELGPTFVYNVSPQHGRFLPFAELRTTTLANHRNFTNWSGLTAHVAAALADMGVTDIVHNRHTASMDVFEWCESDQFMEWLLCEPTGVPDTVQQWMVLRLLGKEDNAI